MLPLEMIINGCSRTSKTILKNTWAGVHCKFCPALPCLETLQTTEWIGEFILQRGFARLPLVR